MLSIGETNPHELEQSTMEHSLAVPKDTSLEAARVHFAALRRLGGPRRLEMGVELSNTMRSVVESGVRDRHPNHTNEEVRLAVLRVMVGEELFRQCCPNCDVEP